MPLAESPSAETAAELADRNGAGVPSRREAVSGWGGGVRRQVTKLLPASAEQAVHALDRARAMASVRTGLIARGMGRAYNDAAQRGGGVVIETTAMRRFELDASRGTVTAEAGVTLGELLAGLVPQGWVVPVLPGTQHVSVGGAIASDIHGKNHGVDGAFGAHVEALTLLTAAGELLELEPGDPDGVFAATLGGMGLTGIVVRARIRLRPVRSAMLSVDTDRVGDLDAALAALQAPGGRHRVAWLDLLGPRPGRGIVTRAEHVAAGPATPDATVRARATVPPLFPSALLRAATVAAFNELRFRAAPRCARGTLEGLGAHMFPLDGLTAWPRLYGAKGFVQYQLVVPYGQERALHDLIGRLRRARVPCYLAVLKDFGPAGAGPLSFPIPGWTLALDMPRRAPCLEAVLREFDELVAAAGGRVYLAKNPWIRPDALDAMYPRLAEWRAVRDRVDPERLWRSDMAVRAGLVAP